MAAGWLANAAAPTELARTELSDGDRLMRVRVVESWEELDYQLAQILDDPPEG